MPEYLGYHGTRLTCGQSILSKKCFHLSIGDRHWLGDGVYFFENLEEAKLWGRHVLQDAKDAVVVRAKIASEDGRVLDLTSLGDLEYYVDFLQSVRKKIQNKVKPGVKMHIDGYAINMLCGAGAAELFDVVRAPFPSHSKKLQAGLEYSAIVPIQIQLCVRNTACIQSDSIELVA